jgi:hypothetical protein
MTNQTLICGIALIVIGAFGYINGQKSAEEDYAKQVEAQKSDPAVEPKMKDVKTALIPAAFGVLLLLCAVVVIAKPGLRKHVMHLAAVIGVLGFIGGFVPLIRAGDFDVTKPAVRNGLFMALVCAVFVYFCVQSFIEARKAREAAAV